MCITFIYLFIATCSSNVILPGVNMVSSPITVSQLSVSGNNEQGLNPKNTTLSSSDVYHQRFSSSGSNFGPSPMRATSVCQPNIRPYMNHPPARPINSDRYAFPISPNRHPAPSIQDIHHGFSQNPKIITTQGRRGRRKHANVDDVEMLSSNSSSDSSSGEE